MPEFANIKWMVPLQDENMKPVLVIADPAGQEGKLSMHGSGMMTYRPHANKKGHQLIMKGNILLDKEQGKIGARHLFTVFFQEPKLIPTNSPARNRESDYLLELDELKPFVMIFFAIPSLKLKVEIGASFHIDDIISVPPETGWGSFDMRQHNVVWFYYRTKHMDKWPQHTHICYHEGFMVPMFIGTGEGTCRIEIRQPIYIYTGSSLNINLPILP